VGTLTIDGGTFRTGVFSSAYAKSSGRTGTIEIVARDGVYLNRKGNVNIANYAAVADPAIERGTITVITPLLRLANESKITAESVGRAAASKVHLMPSADGTGNMSISGDSSSEISSGTRLPTDSERGNVYLNALPVTAGTGDGGDVDIRASNLTLSDVNLLSQAAKKTTGSAGKITLAVTGQLSILNNTQVVTDTAGKGHAGDIQFRAGTLFIDPSLISSRAADGSGGQTGNIQVGATDGVTVADGSKLSIENNAHSPSATFRASTIMLAAPQISLLEGQITANSLNDAPASNVQLSATDRITLRNGAILTTSARGDGGSIRIDAGGAVLLDHSRITTSVLGSENGNAGDIGMTTPVLILNAGFIQANTRAPRAKGGNVVLNVDAVVASGTTLVGGDTLLQFDPRSSGLNVIQAAAPEGVSGNINVSGPLLDVAGSMRALNAESVQNGPLARDACRIAATSSFTAVGRGGLRPVASG
jgi:hypothetical protein